MTDDNPSPGNQHDAKHAHLQVLTAGVGTLEVGSRQVTMSVYNQLDEVQFCHIELFGRARTAECARRPGVRGRQG